jgi:hypothetical protein
MRRRDPLQGREFELGDNVVVCTKCKCVQTYDSWEFNENTCVQCGHNERVDTFSREYIELSYHMDDKPLKKIPGFKVMESDIKYQTDKIRKWFSQQRIARTYKGLLWIYIILLILVMGLSYYWGHDSIEYCVSTTILPLFSNALAKLQYVFEGKLSGLSIVSRLNVDDKIYNLNSDKDEILYIGDDVVDAWPVKEAGLGFIVGDAVEELDAVADLRLTKIGGRGAVREAIEWLLKEQGKWETLMSRYFE